MDQRHRLETLTPKQRRLQACMREGLSLDMVAYGLGPAPELAQVWIPLDWISGVEVVLRYSTVSGIGSVRKVPTGL